MRGPLPLPGVGIPSRAGGHPMRADEAACLESPAISMKVPPSVAGGSAGGTFALPATERGIERQRSDMMCGLRVFGSVRAQHRAWAFSLANGHFCYLLHHQ
jgi:hypothetical protein